MSAGGSGRYTRKNSGMLGAMIVTVGIIIIFVAFRAITRDDLVIERETVDYLSVVEALQEGRTSEIAYPPALPEGRRAVDASVTEETVWKLDTLHGNTGFLGVYQCRVPVKTCAQSTLQGDAERGKEITVESALGTTWQSWKGEDGDRGISIELEDAVVMVFGTAGQDEIEAVAASLVTDPVSPDRPKS